MYNFYYVLLLITFCGNIIYCQKQRINIDNYGIYSSVSITCSNGNCHQYTTIILGSILGGGIGIILLFIAALLYFNRCKGRPSVTNFKFINSTNYKNNKYEFHDPTILKSGVWTSRHFQCGMWHACHQLTLSFDPQLFKVTGSGLDNIGTFTIGGTYSLKTRRIGLTKIYQLACNQPSEDLKYQMIIQLMWNIQTRQFEGKWYVQTKKYREEDIFTLKFSKQS